MSAVTPSRIEYSATFVGMEGDLCLYRVDEWKVGGLIRSFTGRISCPQRATSKGSDQQSDLRSIERWCQLHPERLPEDGGTIDIDLSSLQH